MEELRLRILFVGGSKEVFDGFISFLSGTESFESAIVDSNQEAVFSFDTFRPTLIIGNLQDPQIDWKELLLKARKSVIPIPVIVTGSKDSIDAAIEVIREGAQDFILLPLDPKGLVPRLQKAMENRLIHEQLRNLQQELQFRRNADYIVGGCPKIQSVLGQVLKVGDSDIPVLIMGESGTGKELVARAIHYNSRRAGKPFLSVNCAAISEDLFENELFGHVRGSYTGADRTTPGLYGEADRGTLFLDEIGDLSLSTQTKLLKVVETGEYRHIGGTETLKVDVRLVTATNKNLEQEVLSGEFREDFYYRLNGFPIRLPPLRERKEDIPQLITHFFRLYQADLNRPLEGFSPAAIQKLMFYPWPGNVRELANKVRQAMINAVGPRIFREDIELDDSQAIRDFKSLREAKQDFERNYMINVLRIVNGNVTEAARLAKKDRKDFYDVMNRHKIKPKEYRET